MLAFCLRCGENRLLSVMFFREKHCLRTELEFLYDFLRVVSAIVSAFCSHASSSWTFREHSAKRDTDYCGRVFESESAFECVTILFSGMVDR